MEKKCAFHKAGRVFPQTQSGGGDRRQGKVKVHKQIIKGYRWGQEIRDRGRDIREEGQSLYKNNRREARNSNARTRIENNAMVQSVDEIILFFNEIRLIMISSHFARFILSLSFSHGNIHIHTYTYTLFLSLFLSFSIPHSFRCLSLFLSLPLILPHSLQIRIRLFTQFFTHSHCTTMATIIIVIVI